MGDRAHYGPSHPLVLCAMSNSGCGGELVRAALPQSASAMRSLRKGWLLRQSKLCSFDRELKVDSCEDNDSMTTDKATPGWRTRLAERRADRRQRRAWRRERRKGSIDPGGVGATDISKVGHGQTGPAGQQGAVGSGGSSF